MKTKSNRKCRHLDLLHLCRILSQAKPLDYSIKNYVQYVLFVYVTQTWSIIGNLGFSSKLQVSDDMGLTVYSDETVGRCSFLLQKEGRKLALTSIYGKF